MKEKTLEQLAAEYRAEAENIKLQIEHRKAERKKLPKFSAQRLEQNHAIAILSEMLRDTLIIADGLEHYYEKDQNRLNGIYIYMEEDDNIQP